MDQTQLMNKIKSVIEEFKESKVQSEKEVCSKFIVPLSEALGYPPRFRAEEFPIYGYAGGEKLRAKPADFLFFDDKNFADYRKNTLNSKNWVEDHSLLIIEAKKPLKMPENLGQARFYTMWSKAIAYIETDGIDFKAYLFNSISNDVEIIDKKVDELSASEELSFFCYERLLALKKKGRENAILANEIESDEDEEYLGTISNDDDLNLPENTIRHMRECLGRNAEGLTKLQLTSKFLNFTNALLQTGMRYDVPSYIYDYPREFYQADLFINERTHPLMSGEVAVFYWEDKERFQFDSDDITLEIEFQYDTLFMFNINYKGTEKQVNERILGMNKAIELFDADSITLKFKEYAKKNIFIRFKKLQGLKTQLRTSRKRLEPSLLLLKMLRSIEEYYEIKFELRDPTNELEMEKMVEGIHSIYNGTCLGQNCSLPLKKALLDDLLIDDCPVLFNDGLSKFENRFLYGVEFEPFRLYILPFDNQKLDDTQEDGVLVPACCEYKPILN